MTSRPPHGNTAEGIGARSLLAGTDPADVLTRLAAAAERSIAAERAAGIVHVSLIHGDLETSTDSIRLARVREIADAYAVPDAAGHPTLLATRGTNDTTTWLLRGSRAGAAQAAIVGRITEVAASWWRWSTSGVPATPDGTGPSQTVGR